MRCSSRSWTRFAISSLHIGSFSSCFFFASSYFAFASANSAVQSSSTTFALLAGGSPAGVASATSAMSKPNARTFLGKFLTKGMIHAVHDHVCVCVCLWKNECLLILSEARRDGGSDVMALPLPKHYYYYRYFIREYHFHFLRLGISGWVLWVFYGGIGLWVLSMLFSMGVWVVP